MGHHLRPALHLQDRRLLPSTKLAIVGLPHRAVSTPDPQSFTPITRTKATSSDGQVLQELVQVGVLTWCCKLRFRHPIFTESAPPLQGLQQLKSAETLPDELRSQFETVVQQVAAAFLLRHSAFHTCICITSRSC